MASTTLVQVPSPLATFKPALKPPPGVTPNPENPASLSHLATLTIAICIPLLTIFFFLRTYVRVVIRRTWIFEDYLVTTAWAGAIAYCGIMRATMSNNGGKHGWDITPNQAHLAAYWFNVAAIEYGVMIGLTKITVLVLYRRIFSPQKWSAFDITIVVLITLMVGFYGSTSIVKIFLCTPRERIWNKTVPGKCVNMAWILNTSGAFNTVTDYVILLLPVRAVWNMHMNPTKKVLVVCVFTFGSCAPIFATIGFVVRIKNSFNPDSTWKQPEILLWGAAELTSGLLCVCFPEMGALLPSTRRKIRKSNGRSGGRRPTASELQGWREPISSFRSKTRKHSNDPYMTKSLTDTAFSTKEVGSYIELEDAGSPPMGNGMGVGVRRQELGKGNGHGVHIGPVSSDERLDSPRNGVVVMKSEFRIERHEVV